MPNDKYLSKWSGENIDRAYEAVQHLGTGQVDKLTYVDSYGNLRVTSFKKEKLGLIDTVTWESVSIPTNSFLIKNSNGEIAPSNYNYFSFIGYRESGATTGPNGCLASFYSTTSGGSTKYFVENTGITTSQINIAFSDIDYLKEAVGTGGTDRSLITRVSNLETSTTELQTSVQILTNKDSEHDLAIENINTYLDDTLSPRVVNLETLVGDTSITGTITSNISNLNSLVDSHTYSIEDIQDELGELDELVETQELRADEIFTETIKYLNGARNLDGLEIYEDSSVFRLQHDGTNNGTFKLETDSAKTVLTGTSNDTPQLVLKQDGGFALLSGNRRTTLSVNDDYSIFSISAETFSLAGANNMLLIDHDSLRYNQGVGGKTLITASPNNTVISGGNGSMAADNNSTRLIYGAGANPNILSIDSDSADLRINGTSAKIEINNNIMQMKLGDYKVLTDQNYGYFELTGTSGILTAEQLAQAAKRYCVIRANNKNYIKAYDNNFYYFEMPYAYNYQETIEGVIYNYLTHKWPFSVLRINLSRYEISSVPLEMMSYDQIKLLVNQCVSGDITHLISQVQVDDPSKVPSSALMYSVNSRVVELETQLAEALTTIRGLTSRIESLEAEKDKLYRQGVMYRDDTIYEINIYDDHGVYLGSGIHYDNQGNAEVVGYTDGTARLYSYDGTKQLIIEGSDSDLEQRLEDEIRNRQNADTNLQLQIDSITGNYIRVRNGS